MLKIPIVLFCIGFSLWAEFLPKHAPHVGGVIVEKSLSAKEPIKAFHEGKPLKTFYTKGAWHVLAGVPLLYSKKYFPILIRYADGSEALRNIRLEKKEYKKQYITLKTNKHVSLSQKNLNRHYKEKKRSKKALTSFSTNKIKNLAFIKPVDVKISDDFGKRRYFNKQPRKPHSGVDMAAPVGTAIKAPANAKVLISSNFFFNGNTVYLDHGEGVVSLYCHLDKIYVKEGDVLKQGDVLGTVGKTGRVTGAHLHWGVSLNGAMVDPRFFIDAN